MQKALAASNLVEPAELHGLACGMASATPGSFSLPDFIDLVGTDVLVDDQTTQDFIGATLEQLHTQDMEFHLLIPEDDERLSERVAGAANWCAAFLTGFGAGLARLERDFKELPDDVQEILRDFSSLSGLDEDVTGGEQDEASFMEIYEYVRIAAILTHTLMMDDTEEDSSDRGRVH